MAFIIDWRVVAVNVEISVFRPTAYVIYSTVVPFDPEGLLGCLTSVFTVFMGVQAGKTLLAFQSCRSGH